jgi:methylmalonyl-CoA mutase cobalamin-binding subunit
MGEITNRTRTVLLSTVSSDSHTWNLVFLELLLAEHGYRVINLGPCVPDDLLVHSARRHRPDAVVISTVNGHGYLDGDRLIRTLRQEPDLADLPVMIGGKLGIAAESDDSRVNDLIAAGFTAVFTDSTGADELTGRLATLSSGAEAVAR